MDWIYFIFRIPKDYNNKKYSHINIAILFKYVMKLGTRASVKQTSIYPVQGNFKQNSFHIFRVFLESLCQFFFFCVINKQSNVTIDLISYSAHSPAIPRTHCTFFIALRLSFGPCLLKT